MRKLYFEEVPDPEVDFRGNTRRNSVWESRRENLPDEVQEGVAYRNAGLRLRSATEIFIGTGDDFRVGFDKERVTTGLVDQKRTTRGQEAESGKGKK